MKIEIYPETCCELCNSTIHNHMDCPACGKKYAGTESYHDIMEDIWDYEEGKREEVLIECQECRAVFKFISRPADGIWMEDCEWEKVSLS